MKKLAILGIAATVMATTVSLPRAHAQAEAFNPQGVLKPEPFADVPPDHWAHSAVEQLRQAGLTEGYPDRTFKGKRPMTRYEFARFVQLLLQSLQPRFASLSQLEQQVREMGTREVPPAGLTQQQLNDAIAELRSQILTREQVQQIVRDMLAQQPQPTGGVTPEQLQTLQRLVDEFRDQLARLGVDVDAVKKELADLRGRVETIEAQLARMPKITGDLNLIGKGSWKSDQVFQAGVFRPVFDHDGRPLNDTDNVLEPVLPYYDLDLGITAMPTSNVRVAAILNVGNYVSSYRDPIFHLYDRAGTDVLTPVHAYMTVPFNFLGANEITVGRQPTQLTSYTFKAIDPDTYTFIPREDSGDVIFWGVNTTWRMGSAKLRAFAGVNPVDGRLEPLNVYPDALFGTGTPGVFGAFTTVGSVPIVDIGNFAGARLSFGEPETGVPADLLAREVSVAPTSVQAPAAEQPTPAAEPGPGVDYGYSYGPIRNAIFGINWLMAGGDYRVAPLVVDGTPVTEDARAQVVSADARFKLGRLLFNGEFAWGESQTGRLPRARALDDTAVDLRAQYNIGLGFGDLGIGGGWRRIELGYNVPGYWGYLGSWKNPRGIEGWMAQAELPLRRNVASFLRNITLRGSAEWYEGTENVPTAGAPAGFDPSEENLRIDRYQAGIAFNLTDRNPVTVGFEQVFRNYVAADVNDAPLALPTMGVAGSPLVGSRIKNTETYINFGIGHNFTEDINLALVYQLVDFGKYDVDVSNQPANYRGYIASAQVGVRF